MLDSLRRLPRTVWLIGLMSLFNDAASEMLYPLIPLLVANVLLGGPRALGIIEGIAEAAASLLKLVSGAIADRSRSTKPLVLAGYGIAGISRPLIALAGSWPMVLLLRVADRIGKGLRSSPRDALLGRSVPASERGLAFGFHRGMDNAGAVIGPLMAAGLLASGVSIKGVFACAIVPAIIVMLLGIGLKEPPAPAAHAERAPLALGLKGLSPGFKRYLLVLALFTLGGSSNMFLLLRAHDLGVAQTLIPILWALTSLTATLFGPALSAWSDRIGRQRLLLSGWTIYFLFYLLLAWNGLPSWAVWPLFAVYGIFMAATEGVEKALVADLAPPELLGRAFGWYNLTVGLMLLPASMLFGFLWQLGNASIAFCFGAGCAALAALLLPLALRTRPERM